MEQNHQPSGKKVFGTPETLGKKCEGEIFFISPRGDARDGRSPARRRGSRVGAPRYRAVTSERVTAIRRTSPDEPPSPFLQPHFRSHVLSSNCPTPSPGKEKPQKKHGSSGAHARAEGETMTTMHEDIVSTIVSELPTSRMHRSHPASPAPRPQSRISDRIRVFALRSRRRHATTDDGKPHTRDERQPMGASPRQPPQLDTGANVREELATGITTLSRTLTPTTSTCAAVKRDGPAFCLGLYS